MLIITTDSGREIWWHTGEPIPTVNLYRLIKSIYVDGDEIAHFLGLKTLTHCARGGEVTGNLAQMMYQAWCNREQEYQEAYQGAIQGRCMEDYDPC